MAAIAFLVERTYAATAAWTPNEAITSQDSHQADPNRIVFTTTVDQKIKQHRSWPIKLVFESSCDWNHPQFSKWLVGEVLVDSQGMVRA